MKEMKVRVTLNEEMLGTSPMDEEIYRNFIASKAPDATSVEDEIVAVGVEEVVEKGMTGFPRAEDGCPIMWDYQVKGMFKDACSSLNRVSTSQSKQLKAFKKVIDGTIFVEPRQVRINVPDGEGMGVCERPLRASTAQGERVALASSETVPAGSTLEFTVLLLEDSHEKYVREWLDYGRLRGLGQWRNSGKGRFTWEEI